MNIMTFTVMLIFAPVAIGFVVGFVDEMRKSRRK